MSQHTHERVECGVVFVLIKIQKSALRAWFRFVTRFTSLVGATCECGCGCGCANDEDDDDCDVNCDASEMRDGFTAINHASSSSSSSYFAVTGPDDKDASSVDAFIIISGNSIVSGINSIDWKTTKTDDDGANASDGGDNRWCDWGGRVGVVRDDGVRVGVRVGV